MMNDLIMRAINKEKTERSPIWLMRQAGRYMSEYRELRSKYSFLELCKTPDAAYQVTMQPIKAFGLDAAILFSDILTAVEPLGVNLEFSPAPTISNPVRNMADLNRLKPFQVESGLKYVYDTIKLLVKDLDVPLIGFAGAPFTLACYMVEGKGSKSFTEIRKLMLNDNETYSRLMELLTDTMIKYLQAQIDAGCSIVQIFDTWAGILPPDEYKKSVLPYVEHLINSLKGAAKVYFAKDGANYFDSIKTLKADCIGVDWKIDLKDADDRLDNKFCLQGNLDPSILFADQSIIKTATENILTSASNLKGHIFNLGHGIMPLTPVENVKYLVDLVKNS